MNHALPAIPQLTLLAAFASIAHSPSAAARDAVEASLLGTWAEIVTSGPASPADGRQVIERLPDGTFKLVFTKSYRDRPPCTGTWSASGRAYRMTFTSVGCFGEVGLRPEVGRELELELLASSATRASFKVPSNLPLAAWQAKLEGTIE